MKSHHLLTELELFVWPFLWSDWNHYFYLNFWWRWLRLESSWKISGNERIPRRDAESDLGPWEFPFGFKTVHWRNHQAAKDTHARTTTLSHSEQNNYYQSWIVSRFHFPEDEFFLINFSVRFFLSRKFFWGTKKINHKRIRFERALAKKNHKNTRHSLAKLEK